MKFGDNQKKGLLLLATGFVFDLWVRALRVRCSVFMSAIARETNI